MDEGQFLQDVFLRGRDMGGVTRWAFDPRSHLTEHDSLEVPDAAARLWQAWSPFWDLTAHHLVEKTPLNITRTRFLRAVFPQSTFVVITRHPLTQALAAMKWAPRMPERAGWQLDRLVSHWLHAHEVFHADMAELDRLHVVRYEDVVSDPLREADRLESALGIELDRRPFQEFDQRRAHAYAELWESGTGRLPLSWRGAKAAARVAAVRYYRPRIHHDLGDRMAALGYSVHDVRRGSARLSAPVRTEFRARRSPSSDPNAAGDHRGRRPMVFIGGLQRSGTTLLGRLLASHPDVAGLVGTPTKEDEGQFVQDVYLDDHKMGRRDGRPGGGVNRWAYHPEAHLTEADALSRDRATERLTAAWAPYWSRREAQRYVEKSPSNLTRTRFLQELFPEARFIVITRHPAIQALAVRKWTRMPQRIGFQLSQIVDHWLTAMETFEADRPFLRHVTVVRYEDLVARPAETITELLAFLGLEPAAIDVGSVRAGDGLYERYWDQISSPRLAVDPLFPSGRPIRTAVRALERVTAPVVGPLNVRRIRMRYGDRIARLGYDVDDVG